MTTTVKSQHFGVTKSGEEVTLFTIASASGACEVGVINYGATLVFLRVLDHNGKLDDVVAGFADMEGYHDNSPYLGCVVGRYGNRIAKGKFQLDGVNYQLAVNNGPNALHGGLVGFNKKLWSATVLEDGVKFSLVSNDGEEGYPGDLTISTTYTLKGSELSVNYSATTTKATPISITNHSYFNLGGHSNWGTDLSKHEITLHSDNYLPCDDDCLVTGEIKAVADSKYDLRVATKLDEDLLESIPGGGYDNTFCLPLTGERYKAATVSHVISGRTMIVETTAPGVQLYTANYLSGEEGKNDVSYPRHSAFCLETQNWPDSINNVSVHLPFKNSFEKELLFLKHLF